MKVLPDIKKSNLFLFEYVYYFGIFITLAAFILVIYNETQNKEL
jgi:hypothetical protein